MSQPSAGLQDPQHAPRKNRSVRNALLASGGGALVLVIAIAAFGGPGKTPGANLPAPSTVPTAAAKTTPAPSTPPTKTAEPEPVKDENKTTVRKVGAEFTVGKGATFSGRYTVQAGWVLRQDYGVPILEGRVKNVDDKSNALPNLQIKFLNGPDLVMSFTCAANELEPGQTTKLNCFSTDDYTTKWKTITAETGR